MEAVRRNGNARDAMCAQLSSTFGLDLNRVWVVLLNSKLGPLVVMEKGCGQNISLAHNFKLCFGPHKN
jgi:hypothetical protein